MFFADAYEESNPRGEELMPAFCDLVNANGKIGNAQTCAFDNGEWYIEYVGKDGDPETPETVHAGEEFWRFFYEKLGEM